MDSGSSTSSSSSGHDMSSVSSGSSNRRILFHRGIMVCAAAAAQRRQGGRRYFRSSHYWKRPRNYKAYYRLVRDCRDDLYQHYFHVSKASFNFVLTSIRDHPWLQRNCRRRDYLPPEEQFAIALSYFAKGGSFQLVGGHWGCSVTSVHRCVEGVSRAIRSRLSNFMAMPSTDGEWQELVVGFSDFVRLRWGIQQGLPQVALAMDGVQIPIMRAPPSTGHEFYNYKGFNSINVHCVCDHKGVARVHTVAIAAASGTDWDTAATFLFALLNLHCSSFAAAPISSPAEKSAADSAGAAGLFTLLRSDPAISKAQQTSTVNKKTKDTE
ncbi:hypothetical protein QJQ45_029530, partial [Haematococcus lacustris]